MRKRTLFILCTIFIALIALITGCPTPGPDTQGPDIPEPTIPEPTIPEPTIPEPTIPEPTIPEPDTPEPTIPEPDTPEPTIPEPDTGDNTPTPPDPVIDNVTPPDKIDAPFLITAGHKRLAVSWTLPNGYPIEFYELQYSEDGSGSWEDVTLGYIIRTTPQLIEELENGTAYVVQIRAKNAGGYSEWSDPSNPATPDIAPAAPPAPTLDVGNGRLVVNWAPPATDNGGTAIIGYKLQYSVDGGAAWAPSITSGSTGTNLTIAGLINGESYKVRVSAVNGVDGAWSPPSATAMLPIPVLATQVPAGTAASVVLSTDIDNRIIAAENPTITLTPVTAPSTPADVTLPTVNARTGLITVTATTTAGTYTVSGVNEDGDEVFPTEYFSVTVSPQGSNDIAKHIDLKSKVTAGIATWGNTADLNYIITTGVTNMSQIFNGAGAFNGDVSKWDVSSVTNMGSIFNGALVFNGDLSEWVVDSVEDMSSMFANATAFNGNISKWNVNKVTTMRSMFLGAKKFNNDISDWEPESVEDMRNMFNSAFIFSQNLNEWAAHLPMVVSGTYTGKKSNMFTDSMVTGALEPDWY